MREYLRAAIVVAAFLVWPLAVSEAQEGHQRKYVYATPLVRDDQPVGALAVILDAGHLESAEWDLWRYNAMRFLALSLVVSISALIVVKSSVTRPIAKISEWTKGLRTGRPVPPPDVPDANLFGPLALEVSRLALSMQRARAAAEEDCCLYEEAKAVLLKVRRDIPFELREIDIESGPALYEAYKERIPLVVIDGRPAFKYHVDEEALRHRLARCEGTMVR